jgi:hypothetical protein
VSITLAEVDSTKRIGRTISLTKAVGVATASKDVFDVLAADTSADAVWRDTGADTARTMLVASGPVATTVASVAEEVTTVSAAVGCAIVFVEVGGTARAVKTLFATSGPPAMGAMVSVAPAAIVNMPLLIEVAVSCPALIVTFNVFITPAVACPVVVLFKLPDQSSIAVTLPDSILYVVARKVPLTMLPLVIVISRMVSVLPFKSKMLSWSFEFYVDMETV